jgi:hypothetical protein
MSTYYRGPSKDASYQVSIHLAEGFQRRRLKCKKLTDDRRRTPSDGKSSHCLWQGDLKKTEFRNSRGFSFEVGKNNIKRAGHIWSLNLDGIFLTSKLKPWEFRTSVFIKGVRPCTCLCIASIFTWIVTRPCGFYNVVLWINCIIFNMMKEAIIWQKQKLGLSWAASYFVCIFSERMFAVD